MFDAIQVSIEAFTSRTGSVADFALIDGTRQVDFDLAVFDLLLVLMRLSDHVRLKQMDEVFNASLPETIADRHM
jgi:hypothetical protein